MFISVHSDMVDLVVLFSILFFFLMIRRPPRSTRTDTLFPYTTLFRSFGYNMIIFLAALQTVPRELDEAARIDGAGWLTRLRHVTLPAIAPTMLLVAVLTVAGMFQLFAEPYVMTRSEERRVGKECVSTCRSRWSQ